MICLHFCKVIFIYTLHSFSKEYSDFHRNSFILQASLQLEKQRADDSERKYTEEQQTSEERQKKLEETEGKVRNLQESVHRLLFLFYTTVTSFWLFFC